MSDSKSAREWVLVHGAEETHEVSDDGQVRTWIKGSRYGRRRLESPRTLSVYINSGGYPAVNYTDTDGRKRTRPVHRVMMESFCGGPQIGKDVAHNDGNKLNCVLSNLRWATDKENNADRKLHGTYPSYKGEKNPRARLTEADVIKIRKDERPVYLIAKELGLAWSTVDDIVKRVKWKHV